MSFKELLFLLLLFVICVLGQFNPANYNSSFILNSGPNDYTIYWKIFNETIQIALVATPLSWVGFGIGEPNGNGSMLGSDIVIATVSNDGSFVVNDMYSLEKDSYPSIDHCNDWTIISGQQTTSTIFEISRALNTGDFQDRPIVSGQNIIIWAFGIDDVLTLGHRNNSRGAFFDFVFFGPNISAAQSGPTASTFGTPGQCGNTTSSSSMDTVGTAGVGAMVGVSIFAIVIIVGMNGGLLYIALKSKSATNGKHIKLADQEAIDGPDEGNIEH